MGTLYYRNPRLLVLTLALILVAGLSSLALLPRKEDPSLRQRFALITTRFPGADAERVELLVTRKLEDAFREFEELDQVHSTSRSGISTFNLRLSDEVDDVQPVWSRVRDKLDDVTPELPDGCEDPELQERESQVDAYTLIYALTWELPGTPPAVLMRRLAEDLEDVLQGSAGTADTKIFGDVREEILVEVEAARLANLDLSAAELSAEIARGDAKVPAGQLRGVASDLLIEVSGELDSLARVRDLPVRVGSQGQVVRLADIAEVSRGIARPTSERALVSGKPGLAVAARMSDGFRIDLWAADTRGAVDAFAAELPGGVGLQLLFDQSRYVEERLDNLFANLLLGAVLVVCVIFFMMGWKSALLVSSALPVCCLMVLEGMQLFGIPIHQMSVTGLIIALGLLIDNAIIMVDEVSGRLRAGQTALEAVDGTTRALGIPLLGSTLTTVFAFLPLVLMPGGAGEFVGALGIGVILALSSSLFVSLTIVPAVTAFFKSGKAHKRGFWSDGFSQPDLTRLYAWSLRQLTRFPLLFVLLAALPPILGFVGGSTLREQFFPPSDRDTFQIQMFLPTHSSFEETWRTAVEARALILEDPAVADVHWFVGGNAPKFYYNVRGGKDAAAYYAQALVQMRPGADGVPVVRRMQRMLDERLPAAQPIVQLFEQGPPFDAPIELHLTGPELTTLDALGEELREVLASLPHVTHTRLTLNAGQPVLDLDVSDTDLQLTGLSNVSLAQQLQTTLEGAVGGSLLEGTFELPVRVRVGDRQRAALADIAALSILSPRAVAQSGLNTVPVAALGELAINPEPASITRRDGERSNSVQGFLEAGVLAAPVLAALKARLAELDYQLPTGYALSFGGESEERNRAVGNLLAYVGLLLIAMVATLVLSFQSFRMASIIGLVGFFSVGLALGALWIFSYPFGFMAIVGAMGLVGVAVNDSIVVLSALREDPEARKGDPEAVQRVVMHATRHVLSTSVTTIAGFTPLLLDGGAFWPPLATAIAGGVSGATLLGLYFVPASYLLLLKLGKRPT